MDQPILSTNFRTTTWVLMGGIFFQLLSLVLTPRIAILLCTAVLLFRFVPTVLISTGRIPNPEMGNVDVRKNTVMFPNSDGSSRPNPSGQGIALLILGIKINHPLGFFAPNAKEAGEFFTSMVAELNNNKTKYGFLSGSMISGQPNDSISERGHFSIIGYFKTVQHLHDFAHGPLHRDAWNWWNKNAKDMPHLGIYHEIYDVPKHSWEAVYVHCPPIGLAQAQLEVGDKDGNKEFKSLITDARKGIWRSSAGRMGRQEGKIHETESY
ncbi:hypothetical protein EJ08DRAFT_596166 [Tothia fuscella]|uniref:Monooxygenase n=1 Tax=Tothia fuscella TaxID=1048955 RepID=A0A9P4NIY7_9PEZI|nr:hypothetical protein EJ08DRAFT_596166 [Tothia fuscella]